MSRETHLWRVIESWRTSQPWPPSQAKLAREIGVAPTAMSQWKLGQSKPTPKRMRALQAATGIRYRDLLDAILMDMGYLPFNVKEVTGNAEHPAPTSNDNVSNLDSFRGPKPPKDAAAYTGETYPAFDDQSDPDAGE